MSALTANRQALRYLVCNQQHAPVDFRNRKHIILNPLLSLAISFTLALLSSSQHAPLTINFPPPPRRQPHNQRILKPNAFQSNPSSPSSNPNPTPTNLPLRNPQHLSDPRRQLDRQQPLHPQTKRTLRILRPLGDKNQNEHPHPQIRRRAALSRRQSYH